jgi:TonB family protein
MMDGPATRFGGTTLPLALAASVAVHVSTFAVLVGVDGGPPPSTRAFVPPASPVLEARLVARAAAPSLEPPAPPPTVALTPPTPPEPPVAAPAIARQAPGAAKDAPSPVGWKPRIVVNDRVPRARFGDALEGDALAGFPIEVDAAVVVPDRIEIPFPRSALAARKEGAVLLWAVIDENGGVEATNVVEGDPEFAQAVEAALARTQFVPARDLGKNLRYYVTLEVEFRLDAAGGTVTAER